MWWRWLIIKGTKILMVLTVLGIGVWYLSSSIGGASLSYISVDTFMNQVASGRGDQCQSGVTGCFLCCYVKDLFVVMGKATSMFWNGIVENLWILMAIGFGIFLAMHTIKFFREQATSKDVQDLTNNEPKLDIKKWFEQVWKTGIRVLVVGALIGMLNGAGSDGNALRTITRVTVSPVMYVGSVLSMAATGVISNKTCEVVPTTETEDDVLTPVLQPFMCVMGNLNTVMLAGAGGGFALMNYAWMDLNDDGAGGGFTWLAGLGLVIMFLIIGFDLLFQVLTVIVKLVFVIIFMPLLLAAVGFEQVWGLAKGLMNSAIDMLVNSAVSILKISLKICIIYAIVFFSADHFYPGPQDGFTVILPPLLSEISPNNLDAQNLSVMNAFSTCEKTSLVDGKMDRDLFKQCFKQQKEIVEAKYDKAFDFMSNGFDFLLFMIGVCLLYFWVVSPKIDALLSASDNKETFDYGQWVKDTGKLVYKSPEKVYDWVKKIIEKGT